MNSPQAQQAADDESDGGRPHVFNEEPADKITHSINANLMKTLVGVNANTFNKFIAPSRILGNTFNNIKYEFSMTKFMY